MTDPTAADNLRPRDGHAFPPRSEQLLELSREDARLLEGVKIVVVMPAYNAGRTLRMTWEAIP